MCSAGTTHSSAGLSLWQRTSKDIHTIRAKRSANQCTSCLRPSYVSPSLLPNCPLMSCLQQFFSQGVHNPGSALATIIQFPFAAVMLMRAYAFSGRKTHIAVTLGVCYASLLAIDVWAFASRVYMPPAIFYVVMGPSGCFPNYGYTPMAMRLGVSWIWCLLTSR